MRLDRRGLWRLGLASAASWLLCVGLTGCQYFFVCDKASCPTSSSTGTTTTSNTGDYAYVSNSTSGSTYLSAYNVANGTLASITGSPFSLGYVPLAMKVSPNNSFLYVGAGTGGVYLYTIGSGGVLSSASGNPQVTLATGAVAAMEISPDGNYLFVQDQSGSVLYEYPLNTSTGALTGNAAIYVPGSSTGCTPSGSPISQSCSVSVSPVSNGSGFVAVALGSSGTTVYPYTSTQGITSNTSYGSIPCCSAVASPSGDFSVAFDNNDYLYIARTLALSSYGNVNTTSPVNTGNITFGSGVTPRGVTISKNGSYLYTANKGVGTISGFTLTGSGGLSALSGNSFAGPAGVSALGADNSGSYLVAAGYDANAGVQLFKPTSGSLGSAVATAGTGTNGDYPVLLAMTH